MKILMVCLGNICRSPMAQGILEQKAREAGLEITVDSAATSNYHIGDPPDNRAVQKVADYGIDISHYRGRQIEKADFKHFDKIFAMDFSNYENITKLAAGEEEISKVEMILNQATPGSNMSVPDPYYGGEEGFENVYRLLDAACEQLIQNIKGEQG
jgi:protein-tyrosine phosphatase